MTARTRTSCTLRVEVLENRCLLNGANLPFVAAQSVINYPSAPPQPASAAIQSPTSSASQPSYPDTDQDDKDDVTHTDASSAVRYASSANLSPDSSSVYYLPQQPQMSGYTIDSRGRDTDSRQAPDLDRDRFYSSPNTIPLPTNPAGEGNVSLATGNTPLVATPRREVSLVPVLIETPIAAVATQPSVVSTFPPLPVDPTTRAAFNSVEQVIELLPNCIPEIVPVEIPLKPLQTTVNEVFLNPFADLPPGEPGSVDLSPLDAEAQAFFAHLLNLDPEWTPEMGWSEYLWITAGVILACGGVHYLRAVQRRGNAKLDRAILRLDEEPQ